MKSPGAAIRKRLGRGPMRLDPAFRRIAEQMYLSLAHRITESSLLAGGMDLDDVVKALQEIEG